MSAFLFAFLGAQAAPIQLMSVGSTSPIDAQKTSADAKSRPQLSESFGRVPLVFEADDVEGSRFFCRGPGSQLWLSPVEAVLTFNLARNGHRRSPGVEAPASRATDDPPAGAPLRIKWVGANVKARAVPGSDRSWRFSRCFEKGQFGRFARKLLQVRATYDPDHVFKLPQGIGTA